MVRFSNKPNTRGIRNASNNVEYRAKLLGREGRLFARWRNQHQIFWNGYWYWFSSCFSSCYSILS